MVAVEFDELSHAFDFVGSAPPGENNAYISLDTGQIHWTSELGSLDEPVPDDLETSDRYLLVPHKTDLDLGRSLALRFAGSELPGCQDQVLAFFRSKGAYARFKGLLESEGALERWYKYEAESIEKALKDWCAENGIRIIERDADSVGQRSNPRVMTIHDFQQWLSRYGNAWVAGDPDAVVQLFSADAAYYETPFDEPMIGTEAIHRYWTEGAKNSQTDVTFEVTPVSLSRNTGFACWRATFRRVPSKAFVALDGVLSARFDDGIRCEEFREWWHRKET